MFYNNPYVPIIISSGDATATVPSEMVELNMGHAATGMGVGGLRTLHHVLLLHRCVCVIIGRRSKTEMWLVRVKEGPVSRFLRTVCMYCRAGRPGGSTGIERFPFRIPSPRRDPESGWYDRTSMRRRSATTVINLVVVVTPAPAASSFNLTHLPALGWKSTQPIPSWGWQGTQYSPQSTPSVIVI